MSTSASVSNELPVCRAADLDRSGPAPAWLIRPLWGRAAVGILGGSPKSCKSWLGLDMALSVASASPCLGQFPVEDPGPALLYLAEDSLAAVRNRLEGLCAARHLELEALPIFVITAATLRLDQPTDQRRLAATVARLRPRLLLLDPLVRLHQLNENHASELSTLLGFLRALQRRFDLAVVLVHHVNKRSGGSMGQSLRGTSDLHAFGDSNLYLTRKDPTLIVATSEHRFAPPAEPFALTLVVEAGDRAHLQFAPLSTVGPAPSDELLPQTIAELMRDSDQPLLRHQLRARLRINNQRLGNALQSLHREGRIERIAQGWRLAASHPRAGQSQQTGPSIEPQTVFRWSDSALSGKTESGSGGVHPDKG